MIIIIFGFKHKFLKLLHEKIYETRWTRTVYLSFVYNIIIENNMNLLFFNNLISNHIMTSYSMYYTKKKLKSER